MHQCALCNPKYGRFWNCSDRVVFFLFFLYNLSVRFWNCSDRVVFFLFFFCNLSVRFWNCSERVVFFLFCFYNLSVRFWNCSDRVVFFYFVSTIYQLDFGTVQTEWYFFNLFLQFIS